MYSKGGKYAELHIRYFPGFDTWSACFDQAADEYVSIAVANYRTEPSSPVTPAIHTYSAGTLPEKSHIWQKNFLKITSLTKSVLKKLDCVYRM